MRKYQCPYCGEEVNTRQLGEVENCRSCGKVYSGANYEIKPVIPIPAFTLPPGPWRTKKNVTIDDYVDAYDVLSGDSVRICFVGRRTNGKRIAECLATFPELVKALEQWIEALNELPDEIRTNGGVLLSERKALLKRAKGEA